MKENDENLKFPGFPPEPLMNFWSYPKVMNGFWNTLNGSEQKVLDYILRHTWGFNKVADEISLTQLEKGIENFDKGTGLSRPTTISALKGLLQKGFIRKARGKRANHYELVKDFNYPSKKNLLFGSKKSLPTIKNNTIEKRQYSSSKKKPYFMKQEMRRDQRGKWWVIPEDGGPWLEFAGKDSEIEWR